MGLIGRIRNHRLRLTKNWPFFQRVKTAKRIDTSAPPKAKGKPPVKHEAAEVKPHAELPGQSLIENTMQRQGWAKISYRDANASRHIESVGGIFLPDFSESIHRNKIVLRTDEEKIGFIKSHYGFGAMGQVADFFHQAPFELVGYLGMKEKLPEKVATMKLPIVGVDIHEKEVQFFIDKASLPRNYENLLAKNGFYRAGVAKGESFYKKIAEDQMLRITLAPVREIAQIMSAIKGLGIE